MYILYVEIGTACGASVGLGIHLGSWNTLCKMRRDYYTNNELAEKQLHVHYIVTK